MEKMFVVVFDDETKAYEGSRALNELDSEGSITIYGESVVAKNSDGTLAVKKADGDFPIRTVEGTAIGSLIGLLGGLVGVAVGAVAGALAGEASDIHAAGVDADFLADVSTKLTAGKYAVVADVSEEWVTPVDVKMEELGGVVFRTTKKNFEADQKSRDVAALRADIDGLKAEQAQARADRKAKLQAKIDQLNTKLENKLAQVRQRSEEMKDETDVKIRGLEKREATATGNAKVRIEKRKAEIRKDYQDAERHLQSIHAERLDEHAQRLETKAADLEVRADEAEAKAEQ